jgi:hypothetical protein
VPETVRKVRAPPPWLRTAFSALTVLAAAAAIYLGLANTDTGDPEPGWALESAALHRVAVIVALFLCFYAVIVVLYLAAQGRSFTELRLPGGTGVAEPETLEEETEALDDLSAAGKSLAAAIADHENRLRTLEGLPPLPPDSGA